MGERDQERQVERAPRKRGEEQQGGAVRPVDVVDDEGHRPLRGARFDGGRDRVEQPRALLRSGLERRGPRGGARRWLRVGLLLLDGESRSVRGIEERPEGAGPSQLVALRIEDEQPVRPRLLDARLEQRRLADPGLTGEEEHRPLAIAARRRRDRARTRARPFAPRALEQPSSAHARPAASPTSQRVTI